MEERLQALSLLLLPLPLDRTFEHAAAPQLLPYLGLDPPQPRPQGHTAGRKPTEERGTVGLSSFLLVLINFIGRSLPTSTFSECKGVSRPGAQLGRTKSCTLRHLWSTSTSEQHYTTRRGWSAGGGGETPRLAAELCLRASPKPEDKGMLCLIEEAGALVCPEEEPGRALPRHAVRGGSQRTLG